MTLRIDIILHQQIIFHFRDLLRQIQVTTFEPRLEEQCPVFRVLETVDLAVESMTILILTRQSPVDSARTETGIFAFFGVEHLVSLDQCFDIEVVQVLKSVALRHMLSLLVDYFRISCIHDALDEMRRIVNFGQLLRPSTSLFELILGLFLKHFPALSDQIITRRHLLCNLLLEGQEAFEIEESNVFDGTLNR